MNLIARWFIVKEHHIRLWVYVFTRDTESFGLDFAACFLGQFLIL